MLPNPRNTIARPICQTSEHSEAGYPYRVLTVPMLTFSEHSWAFPADTTMKVLETQEIINTPEVSIVGSGAFWCKWRALNILGKLFGQFPTQKSAIFDL